MNVVVYTTILCPYCFLAKRLLNSRGIEYREERFGRDRAGREQLARLSGGGTTFPQIMIDSRRVDGFAELLQLDRSGALASLASDSRGPVA
jgi:glutaredoxin 3